jgi:carbonic anhydrase
MKALALILAASLLAACSTDQSKHAPHWGYSGPGGPANWASLSGEYAVCAGTEQSPIDLDNAVRADVEDIATDWRTFRPDVLNNGHTVKAIAPPGSTTRLGNTSYDLLEVHWHHPSEHRIAGLSAPLEAHFVHQNSATKDLLVLGVMMVEGEANPAVQTIWDAAPGKDDRSQAKAEMDWKQMLPRGSEVYRYEGSLTTPPCSEIVSWAVFKSPVTVSKAQITAFEAPYSGNNRPVQAQGRRFLLVGQ